MVTGIYCSVSLATCAAVGMLLVQVFLFSLGNSTSVIKSVLNRSISPSCADSSWAAVSGSLGKGGNDQGKQKPRSAEKDCKGKNPDIPSGNMEMDEVQ